MDLTKSVTDDWIVVDSDDEDSAPYQRRAAGAAGSTGGEGDVWQERVKQAKGAALQVKMGITSFFQSLAKWARGPAGPLPRPGRVTLPSQHVPRCRIAAVAAR
jgi:hypothetical protein